jgi:hypothetical protein
MDRGALNVPGECLLQWTPGEAALEVEMDMRNDENPPERPLGLR